MIIANIQCKSWNMLSTKCVLDLQIFVRGEKTLKQCTMPSMWNIYYSFPRYFYCDISYILGIPQLLWIFSTSGMGFVINNVFVTTFSLICTSRLYITLTEEDTFVEIKSAVRMVTGGQLLANIYIRRAPAIVRGFASMMVLHERCKRNCRMQMKPWANKWWKDLYSAQIAGDGY